VVEETHKIKQHIADEREHFGRNLDEIKNRLKDTTDLKAHFDRNTGLILGAAVTGGFLLSLAFRKSSTSLSSNNRESDSAEGSAPNRGPQNHFASPHLRRISETFDDIFAGLVGVFSDKLQSFVADAVPGFREQLGTVTQRDRSSIQR